MAKRRRKARKNHNPWFWVAMIFGACLLILALLWPSQTPSASGRGQGSALDREGIERIASDIMREVQVAMPELAKVSDEVEMPVYAALRMGGIKRAEAWHSGADGYHSVVGAVLAARQKVDPKYRDQIDTIELCLSYGYFEANPRRDRRPFTNIHRGVRGLELRHGNNLQRWSPTRLIAGNISFDRALQRFGKTYELDPAILENQVRMRFFEGVQFLVDLKPQPRIRPMFRGNQVVPVAAVDQAGIRELAMTMAAWMGNQIDAEGRMTYHYFPSRGEASKSNNMIRQFMASLCLARLTRSDLAPSGIEALHQRNLIYNFAQFFRKHDRLGYIAYKDKAKLGAAALAALAIWESPFRDSYMPQFEALAATCQFLHQDDGSFRTFYQPVDRNDNQNFYPGEALLFWAIWYRETQRPEILENVLKSFRYYRAWHRDPRYRNPAFVPWHTQAYYLIWRETRDPELAEFIFEMNDWILPLQQWEGLAYADLRGRFYDPGRPDYGPPHASSTGVYLEGLIDAFCLARELGDLERERLYRRAIVRGLHAVMQLQFRDDLDMFYIAKKARVRGGLRTTVYDNRIRVDNVQHNLMALLKILEYFEPSDYAASRD